MGSYRFSEWDHGAWDEGGIMFDRAEVEVDLVDSEVEHGCWRKLDFIRIPGVIKAGQSKVGMKFGPMFAPVNRVFWEGL